jgi:hypothetical protein
VGADRMPDSGYMRAKIAGTDLDTWLGRHAPAR